MKKTVIQIVLFLLPILFSGCKKDVMDNGYYCDEKLDMLNSYMNMPRPSDSYNYPIRPCMNRWKELTSTSDMIKACEIPPETLKKMSTQAVIQALWEYPFFTEFLISALGIGYRDLQKDMETSIFRNNAYKELLLRKDAGMSLLKRYKLVDPVAKEHMHHPLVLELLFAQPEFLQQLTLKEKKRLVATAFTKNEQRIASGIFGNIKIEPVTLLLIARTMQSAAYAPFMTDINNSKELKRFVSGSMFYGQTEERTRLEQQIIDNGKNFINEKE